MVLEDRVSARGSFGAAGRDAEHEREERTREKGSVRGAARNPHMRGTRKRNEAKFFSESLILAQNERW